MTPPFRTFVMFVLLVVAGCSSDGDGGPFEVVIDVAYPDGQVLEGTLITVSDRTGITVEATVDPDGSATFRLEPGNYEVTSRLDTGVPGPTSGCTWSDRAELIVPDDGKLTLIPSQACS